MRSLTRCIILTLMPFLFPALLQAADDWRIWRGPTANGLAASGETPPVTWSETENIHWKTRLPGRGHASPIVVNDRILLATADESQEIQSVICLARESGEILWKTDVSQGGFAPKIHQKNTHASPTLASNGELVFAAFPHHESIQLTALDLAGNQRWQIRAGGFLPKAYQFGYAPSPILYQGSVIVAAEYEKNGYLAAFDQQTGREIWRLKRPEKINFSTPVVTSIAGKEQLLLSGNSRVASFDPHNGREFWSVPAPWIVSCGTMVWDRDLVFASGGFPTKGTIAVQADGSKKIAWSNRVKCYEQSMLAFNGYLYAVDDNGIAYCWEAQTGKEQWKHRLGGKVSSSLVLANDCLYLTNERGTTFVFRANPEKFELLSENQLGDECFASPAICGNQIFHRAASRASGKRQETLYCIGK
ncbi:outer membrane biogenesis protein BamB [Gimesia panareensis]|uniref:Outer membrane biogenesis protein BamB n=1 Tax=Gimesia panareensis TaxID=2527978 RepID=A0A517QAL8_9PLAN|nr:PQQ-binding-like beta-propeller repeat protein [Gimesia panareensis]QDT28663.1 outer membrane biogenesis protein BamB [Gimesia panareensis]QDV19405.1 outer membrane biogenesis protein BamB [Gimesia panareensis]